MTAVGFTPKQSATSARSWSNAGAASIEISATLPTVSVHMRMPGLEEAF